MNPRFKKGLQAGCLVLAVVFMILLGGFIYFARNMGEDYKEVKATEEQLVAAHGPRDGFVPPDLGIPSPERLEVFLSVRESGAEWRANLEREFGDFMAVKGDGSESGGLHFIRLLRATAGLSPVMAGFWTNRNESLLAADMAPGEYVWIYCLAYYAWLGFDPAAGAADSWTAVAGLEGSMGADADPDKQLQAELAGQRVSAAMLPIMRNILDAGLPATDSQDAAALIWFEDLRREVSLMEADVAHVPWLGRLPAHAADAFVPYETRFRDGFSQAVNPIELMFGPVFGGDEE